MILDKHRATIFFLSSFFFIFIFYQTYTHPQVWRGSRLFASRPSHSSTPDELHSFLRPHIGDRGFQYARKSIRVRHGNKPDNRSLPALDILFDPHFIEVLDLKSESTIEALVELDQQDAIELELPSPQYRDHKPKLMFGLATDLQRLRDNLGHMRLWMGSKGVSVLAIVPPDGGAKELQASWRKMDIDITIIERDASFFDRLLSLVPDMFDLARNHYRGDIEWYTILDDDTFLPSVSRFASTLAGYDHERPFYIGGISEPKADLSGIGYFAYGGAGMVFSSALVEELAPNIPDCIATANVNWGGDGRLAECVTRYTRTRLTYLRDLHQMDILGDQSGIYESGFKPLSLHHWRGWADIPMPKVAEIAALTGGRGLFQRWRFSDGWVLTNGYSLVKYHSLAKKLDEDEHIHIGEEDPSEIDFAKMEFTWNEGQMSGDFDHSLGPFRPRLGPDQKTAWFFVDSLMESDNTGPVRQLYLRQDGQHGLPEVIELVWSA